MKTSIMEVVGDRGIIRISDDIGRPTAIILVTYNSISVYQPNTVETSVRALPSDGGQKLVDYFIKVSEEFAGKDKT